MLSTIVLIALTVGCLGGEDKSESPAIYVTPVLVLDDEEIIVEPGRVIAISGNVAPIVNESCVVDLISMGDSVGSATILQNEGNFSITVNGLFDESDIIVQVECSRSGDLEPQTVRSVVHSDEATTQTDGVERLSEPAA